MSNLKKIVEDITSPLIILTLPFVALAQVAEDIKFAYNKYRLIRTPDLSKIPKTKLEKIYLQYHSNVPQYRKFTPTEINLIRRIERACDPR